MLKSRVELFPKIEERVKALHSSDLPEIIALPIAAGSEAYLNWIEHETASEYHTNIQKRLVPVSKTIKQTNVFLLTKQTGLR